MAKKEVVKINESQLREIVKESVKKVLDENVAYSLEHYNSPSSEYGELTEMARIDNPHKDSRILGTKEVWIYGNDRDTMSPHFHYLDKKGDNRFEVEVKIEDLTICKSKPRAGIRQNRLLTWDGLSDERKVLMAWLESPNSDLPSITNLTALKVSWNQNNRDNQVTL